MFQGSCALGFEASACGVEGFQLLKHTLVRRSEELRLLPTIKWCTRLCTGCSPSPVSSVNAAYKSSPLQMKRKPQRRLSRFFVSGMNCNTEERKPTPVNSHEACPLPSTCTPSLSFVTVAGLHQRHQSRRRQLLPVRTWARGLIRLI